MRVKECFIFKNRAFMQDQYDNQKRALFSRINYSFKVKIHGSWISQNQRAIQKERQICKVKTNRPWVSQNQRVDQRKDKYVIHKET